MQPVDMVHGSSLPARFVMPAVRLSEVVIRFAGIDHLGIPEVADLAIWNPTKDLSTDGMR